MSIFNKIFGGGVKDLTDSVGSVIDNLSTSVEEKSSAKAELTEIVLTSLDKLASYQRDIIVQEMKGNWLQRSWRPLLMLTFGGILLCKWFGFTDSTIPIELEAELMSLLKIGIGGYIVGRSAEKISKDVVKNIDLPFIKKKNRQL